MPPSQSIRLARLAILVGLALVMPLRAGTIPADALPLPNRVANAEMVVVGKVTAFEDKTVTVNKNQYKIAVIAVSDPLMAPRGAKTLRLGFVPPQPGVVVSPRPFEPAVGQEGCFFLTKHSEADFQTAPGQLQFIAKNTANFDKNIALIKRCVKILEDPDTALKGKNADDCFLAAGMLVARYYTRKSSKAQQEPVDADQSKRILEALAAADWTPSTDYTQLSPRMVLGRLPLTAKDGWMPPKGNDPKALAAYAQKWLADNAGSYRLKRYVPEKRSFDSNGVRIQYAIQGKADGEPVLLIHGFTATHEMWNPVIQVLAKDYKVIAMDCRGHGGSDKPHDPKQYGLEMAKDAIRLLDHLKIDKAHVAGYSMGGGIALQLAIRHPERLRSVILGGMGLLPAGSEQLFEKVADSLEQGKGMGPLIVVLTPKGQPPPKPEQIKAIDAMILANNDVKALAACMRGIGSKDLMPTDAQVKAIKVPMAALVGDADPLRVGVDELKKRLPDLKVVVIDKADHISTFSRPEFIDGVKAFLDAQRTGKK